MKTVTVARCAQAAVVLSLTLGGALFLQPQRVNAAGIEFVVNAFEVVGENPLGNVKTRDLLEPFTGAHTSLERLQGAAIAFEQALREQGYTFYRVTLPPQKLKAKTIRLELKSFKIGKISIEGNDYFSDDNISRSIPELRVDHSPNIKELSRSLAAANRHPAKKTDVTFAVNTDTGQLEAKVKVSDESPRGGFIWLDNTGSDRTGETRVGVGFQHSNMFDRDHTLTATATTSPEEVSSVRQLGLNYRIPIYATGGHLDLVAADSNVDSGTVADAFEVKGEGRVLGLRYMHPLPRKGAFRHHLEGSLFDKQFENNISFEGTPIGSNVRSRPLGLQYNASWNKKNVSTSFYLGHYRNLSGGGDNNDEAYASVRSGADSDWSSTRYGASIGYTKNKWVVVGKLDGQSASEPLIPGEQFTAGGSRTVRGFEESELTDDKGYRTSVEVWAPPMKNGLRLLGFADFGAVRRVDALEGERVKDDISSIGLGMRWSWQNKLRAQLDRKSVV